MKYLIINGSPRKMNTCKIIKQVTTNLDGDFEVINLAREDIPLCAGCFNCFTKGEDKCPHFDKINPIMEKIKKSDAVVIGSPVYAMNVSGTLKNFFDHTAYLYHRPQLFTKKALVVVTTAGAGHKKVAKYIDETLRHWGVNKVYQIKMACGSAESLETKKIDKISTKFSNDVKSNKLHSPKFIDVIFFNAWKAMALTGFMEYDAKYWRDTGLIDHDFAPEIKLNIFKKAFAKIMLFVFKRMF